MEEATPVLRITDAARAVAWYRRLGYEQEWLHRFEPNFPAFLSIARNGAARIYLSEHLGDAVPNGLIYLHLQDLEAISAEFNAEIIEQPWGREVHLLDPDDNRVCVGSAEDDR